MRSILVTGGAGQVGLEIARQAWGEDIRLILPDRAELAIDSADSVATLFERHSFAAVINAAAYTAVDKAETEIGAAFAANALGPALLAEASAKAGIPILQVSTDYVFSGDKATPYLEEDPIGPLGVYGASKLAGELAVRSGNPRSVVLRTAWVLSAHRANFLKTMRRLAQTRPEVPVVADQIGCPTSATDIAAAIRVIVTAQLAGSEAPSGVYHFVNAGEASWCDLANAVFSLDPNIAGRTTARPITTADYPTAARRPANSRLSTAKLTRDFGIAPRPWREAIAEIIAELNQDQPREGAFV